MIDTTTLIVAALAVVILPTTFILGWYGGIKTTVDIADGAEQHDEDVEPHPILQTDGYRYGVDDVEDDDET